MSAEVNEDKISLLIQKTGEEATKCKDKFRELVTLHNQLRGIQKKLDGTLPVSLLTKEDMKSELRKIIYDECIEAAKRLKIE